MHIVTVDCIPCIFVVPVSLIKPVVWACFNGEASSIKIELLNIYGNSGGYLHQTISSISLQRMLATVGFTGTNGIQSHPPAHRIIANMWLIVYMTHNLPIIMVSMGDMVRVRLDRGSVLSSALACLSELLCHISVLVLPCLKVFTIQVFFSRSFSLSTTVKRTPVSVLSVC